MFLRSDASVDKHDIFEILQSTGLSDEFVMILMLPGWCRQPISLCEAMGVGLGRGGVG